MGKRYATWEKGYKVVRVHDSSLSSLIVPGGDRSRVVDYVLRRTARPHKGYGPLCVFISLKRANRWAEKWYGTVYKCLFQPSEHDRVWDQRERSALGLQSGLPMGTVLADRVRLTEKVRRRPFCK